MVMKVSMKLVKTAYTASLSSDYGLIKDSGMKFPTGSNPALQEAMLRYEIQDVYADAAARQHLMDPVLVGRLARNAEKKVEVPLISNILQVFGPKEVRMIVSEDCREVFFLKSKAYIRIFNNMGRSLHGYLRQNKRSSCYEKDKISQYIRSHTQLSPGERREMSEHLKTCLICREWWHLIPIVKSTKADPKKVKDKSELS